MVKPTTSDERNTAYSDLLARETEATHNHSVTIDECTDPALSRVLWFILARKKRQITLSAGPFNLPAASLPETQQTRRPAPSTKRAAVSVTDNIVRYQPMNRQIRVSPSMTLLAAAMKSGIPIRHDCGGHGQCGTCRVTVIEGGNYLTPPTPPEQKLLDNLLNQNWRLACQTNARGPVTVNVPPVTSKAK